MKDFLGYELNVFDRVIFIEPGYRNYRKGVILRFTTCYVIIAYIRKGSNGKEFEDEIKQTSNQLILIRE